MYPHDALPLPLRPNMEQYKKQAKELLNAYRSSDPAAVRSWAKQWVEALVRLNHLKIASAMPVNIDNWIAKVADFAQQRLKNKPALAEAQFVIARAQGFQSWPDLANHIRAVEGESSTESRFEAAADATVNGDMATVERLLRAEPALARARSTREHRATLLHYISANGVEGYRQKTPANIVQIADLLLKAGAEVNATCEVYGGGATALGLTATSVHPEQAGVQIKLLELLLEHGARMDEPVAGGRCTLIHSCLANGQPDAAKYLMNRGAPLDFIGAAGMGRIDLVKRFFEYPGDPGANVSPAKMTNAFALACGYGRTEIVEFLLDQGMDVNAQLTLRGSGHTGLHIAAYYGHVGVVDALLKRGARVDMIDSTWRTPPLEWALTGWSMRDTPEETRYYGVVAALVASGATVKREWLADPSSEATKAERIHLDARMQAALRVSLPN